MTCPYQDVDLCPPSDNNTIRHIWEAFNKKNKKCGKNP